MLAESAHPTDWVHRYSCKPEFREQTGLPLLGLPQDPAVEIQGAQHLSAAAVSGEQGPWGGPLLGATTAGQEG